MRTLSIMILSLFFQPLYAAHAADYTEADLQALVKQKNYLEALTSMSKVPPSKRTEVWNQVLLEASLGRIEQEKSAKDCLSGWIVSQDLLKLYPALGKRNAFQESRREVGFCAAKEQQKKNWAYPQPCEIVKEIAKTGSDNTLIAVTKNETCAIVPDELLTAMTKRPKDFKKSETEEILISILKGPATRHEKVRAAIPSSRPLISYMP